MSESQDCLDALDHRRLGRDLDLFSFSASVGGGLPLWHPRGGLVRSLLEDHWRREHRARGYDLVYTPHVGRSLLWETSGHLEFYREVMFAPLELEEETYFVKPMNCPFHMQIFAARPRSYRELPIRYAELGTVYRFERSGVLLGLLRVRGFTQDDAHIFCRPEQLEDELVDVLGLVKRFLAAFDFRDLRFCLSTRPRNAVGSDEDWERATHSLELALERAELEHGVDDGGGAFYGPKLDVHARDRLGREWQLSTVQFDFNLPQRFDLRYIGEDGRAHAPVVIHRALFGSLERFFGVLVEHYSGAFPLWLAPVQARVLPVAERHRAYAHRLVERGRAAGLRMDVDDRGETLAARVRDAELEKVPVLLVVGDREVETGSVSVRRRNGGPHLQGIADWIGATLGAARPPG